MNYPRFAVPCFVALCCGCVTYGYSARVDVALVSDTQYAPRSELPKLYLGQEMPEEPFEQIALIKMTGADGDRMSELLLEVQRRAQQVGADALVSVKVSDTQRESGTITFSSEPDPSRRYTATFVTAVAVRFVAAETSTASRSQ